MAGNYDLEERTLKYAIEVVKICRILPKDIVTNPLISQYIRSGTSMGANYQEANGASSKKDFRNKIFICKKEAKETVYWLKLLIVATPEFESELRLQIDEVMQLTRIFSKICATTSNSQNDYK